MVYKDSQAWLAAAAMTLATACSGDDGPAREESGPAGESGVIATSPTSDPVGELPIDVEVARQRLWPEKGKWQYVAPRPWRQEEMTGLIDDLARTAATSAGSDPLVARAREAGFRLETWTHQGTKYLAMLEQRVARGQAGAFVLRIGPPPEGGFELILQAPHSFFDRHSGVIALRAFLDAGPDARALFVNTLHRHMQLNGADGNREHNPADACHNPEHLFSLASAAIMKAFDSAVVLQVHGFGKQRTIANAPEAVVVVSSGNADGSSDLSTALATKIGSELRVSVARFPEDTPSLGATKNVQGQAALQRPGTDFVHLELSAALRERIMAEDQLQAGLGRAVLAAVTRAHAPQGSR